AQLLQNAAIDPLRAERLDALENAARAAYRPVTLRAKRNVVLIVADALRPDRTSIYGYSRPTTPNLQRIAAEHPTHKFHEVRASCSASACGLVSMLASKYVHEISLHPFSLQE